MKDITIRFYTNQNKVDPIFFEKLEEFAQQYGLRLAKHPRNIKEMRESMDLTGLNREDFIHETESFSKEIGPIKSDSAHDIRELRDSR